MTSASVITVINGPNLAALGSREPGVYGTATQDDLKASLEERGRALGLKVDFFQSDVEGEIVSAVNRASGGSAALVINPAGYSHYSVAIMDAMRAFPGPVAEVHISQVHSRETLRQNLVTARGADVFLAGAGIAGYLHALDILHEMITETDGGNTLAHQ